MNTFRETIQVAVYITIIFLLTACFNENKIPISPKIIPVPNEQIINEGIFLLNNDTKLIYDEELKSVAMFSKTYFESTNKIKLSKGSKNSINFKVDTSINNNEGYFLKITPKEILISAKTQKGAFYGFQSLRQLLPTNFEKSKENEFAIQCLEIKDAPQFVYRGMHLDVGRHFFSVDFIKKYLDLMAMLKMNTFHWHLTEDQGWRIEIKKYPKLQEVAAFRNETLIGHYNDKPQKYDGKKYGGFYTQEEVKDIVKYALERQITVIPEIELPGHAQAAIAAYPELGCTEKQVEVATKWGVFEDIYCTKETTFKFLEDVINEVVELFPGKYIHIGGDEAPKKNWKKCNHCQKLIKKKGLKDEHGLQSYFITRMEKYINSKGKQIIGWDEILEGGLAPNATVMSWRGTKGAVEAAKEHHNVILTPQSHCYFDHYQSTNESEPIAIGGFLPLEKVYHFNPIPKELTKDEEKYVLGAQGNVWTEYMKTPEKVEYMAFPRMIALSEVVWSKSNNKKYEDFVKRLEHFNKKLEHLNVNYANHLYEVNGELINNNGKISYQLKTLIKENFIRYTTDNSQPNSSSTIYSDKIKIDKSQTIKAAIFNKNGKQLGTIYKQKFNLHKAVGKKISLSVAPHKSYNAGGKQALINGISGNNKRYGDKEWLGFNGDDVDITINFDKPTEINSISTRFHNGNGQWIYAPKVVEFSFDGDHFKSYKVEKSKELLVKFNKVFKNKKAKTIKLRIPNYGEIPEGNQGAGHKAWLFIDEIIVE